MALNQGYLDIFDPPLEQDTEIADAGWLAVPPISRKKAKIELYYGIALHLASCALFRNIVKLLSDCGSTLIAASKFGHGDIAELLLNRGTEANLVGRHHGGALTAALQLGRHDILGLLLNHGANAGLTDTLGLFIRSGNHYSVRSLLDHGINLTDDIGALAKAKICSRRNRFELYLRYEDDFERARALSTE